MEGLSKSAKTDGKGIDMSNSPFEFSFPKKCVENMKWKIERKIENNL